MARQKVVNGVYIDLTEEELAQEAADAEIYDLDMNRVRFLRDGLLGSCDFTQLSDASLGDHTAEEWATYRTALKDLPQSYTRVSEVVWPESPPAAKITRKTTAGDSARQSSIDGGGTDEEAQAAFDTAYEETE